MTNIRSNERIELAAEFIRSTRVHLFITGNAGTGKSTFLRNLVVGLDKKYAIVAPTGVAALNAGGETIHSLFQLAFGPLVTEQAERDKRIRREKIDMLRSLDLLVIDEISMVRADTLDAIDRTLKRVRQNRQPFGGVQLLMIGDTKQLSPVCKPDEWVLLAPIYHSAYFFDALVFRETDYKSIEFEEIFRQTDKTFIDLLNGIRSGDATVLPNLNKRYLPDFMSDTKDEHITLTALNRTADAINNEKLKALNEKSLYFNATVEGIFPENIYPNAENLELRLGAQVMFLKNDTSGDREYYNGMLGTVVELEHNNVVVRSKSNGKNIKVACVEWDNVEYTIDQYKKEVVSKVKGRFSQLPIKCAWAITIHKSQGLTFDHVILDSSGIFAHGQLYVALSRCRSLEGLVLKKMIEASAIIPDKYLDGFNDNLSNFQADENDLEKYKRDCYSYTLCNVFDYTDLYDTIKKIQYEFSGALSNTYQQLSKKIDDALVTTDTELKVVGAKFMYQLSQKINECGDYTNNDFIKKRLSDALAYFGNRLDTIIALSQELVLVSPDSQEKAASMEKLVKRLVDLIAYSRTAIDVCVGNFTLKDLRAVQMAQRNGRLALQQSIYKQTRSGLDELVHPDLYHNLRRWRSRQADEENKPLYGIITNRSLVEIQKEHPRTKTELKKIKGVGKQTILKYGDDILKIIEGYCIKNGIGQTHLTYDNLRDESKKIKNLDADFEDKPKKKDTVKETLRLLNENLTVKEIAAARGLVDNTIRTHMAKLIGQGELSINDYINSERRLSIELVVDSVASLSEVKDKLGEEFKYWEIKFVLAARAYESGAH